MEKLGQILFVLIAVGMIIHAYPPILIWVATAVGAYITYYVVLGRMEIAERHAKERRADQESLARNAYAEQMYQEQVKARDAQAALEAARRNEILARHAEQTALAKRTFLFQIPAAQRYAGLWCIAPPGKGKTNVLWQLVNQSLQGNRTVVLMDSKGAFIEPFRHHPNAIVIDYNNVALNPLQLGSDVSSMAFLEYIFSSLLEVQMTGLQKTLFTSVLEVLLHTPNATIEDFREILDYGITDKYRDALRQSSVDTQNFFTLGKPTEFNNNTYRETKDQLKWRLRLLLRNDYLRRIFTSKHISHDFASLLDSRKLIVLDISKRVLWDEGAEFLGRFFLALIWMGAVARSDIPDHDKVEVHVYIDECQTVIARDRMFRTIIQECRSHKIAMSVAHQYLDDLTDVVKPALFNCAVRIANCDDDAAQIAPRLNVKPEEVKLPNHQFACFVRDMTASATRIVVPFLDLSTIPQTPVHERVRPEPVPVTQPKPEPEPEPTASPSASPRKKGR